MTPNKCAKNQTSRERSQKITVINAMFDFQKRKTLVGSFIITWIALCFSHETFDVRDVFFTGLRDASNLQKIVIPFPNLVFDIESLMASGNYNIRLNDRRVFTHRLQKSVINKNKKQDKKILK